MSALVTANFLPGLRLYSAPFPNHPPAILSRFSDGTDPLFPFEAGSDRGLGVLLLCASLYRPEAENQATQIICGLFSRLENDIFKLNRIPFETLQAALEELAVESNLEEQKQIPGILRSVCDFFYQVGSLGSWLTSIENWETCVRELSQGIYWMGKLSRWRTKPRYFLWLASFQPGFATRFPQALDFLWPVGDGHARFYLNILSPKAKKQPGSDPESRMRFFAALGREVFPQEPWKLFQPLDSYLRPDKEHEYLCRRIQGGCNLCPLVKLCPAAKYFVKS